MSERTERPTSDTLSVAFVPSAWRRNLRGFGTIVFLIALVYAWRWMRADEVARSYSDFWGLDPPQLPYGYWFGLDTWLLLGGLARLLVWRLRRDPRLVIGEDRIETAFTQSFTRRVDRDRVTELRFDETRNTIRFEIPDGLVLTVDASLLELDQLGEDVASYAERCARTLDVPLVRV
jgi:hypothetical protein